MKDKRARPKKPAARSVGRPSGATASGRERILEAARSVMSQRPYKMPTAREIAAAAGVDPALVSYHFGTKSELYEAALAAAYERIEAAMVEALAKSYASVEEKVRAAIRAHAVALRADPYAPILAATVVTERGGHPDSLREFSARMFALLGALIDEVRAVRPMRDANPTFVLTSVGGMNEYFFIISPLVLGIGSYGEIGDELVDQWSEYVADLILQGLAAT